MAPIKVNFNSKDGLKITADFYEINNAKGFILLCHKARSNRAEYRESAPRLNQLGYSCLAIDQRSGNKEFGESNETKDRADEKGLATGYMEAKLDIEAAIDYAYELNNKKPILLLGSSYSASLALLISTQTDKIKAVITYSPGEFLEGINLSNEIRAIDIPIYVTSSKNEIGQVTEVVRNVKSRLIEHFKPTAEGIHGSLSLSKSTMGNESYWESLEEFLQKVSR